MVKEHSKLRWHFEDQAPPLTVLEDLVSNFIEATGVSPNIYKGNINPEHWPEENDEKVSKKRRKPISYWIARNMTWKDIDKLLLAGRISPVPTGVSLSMFVTYVKDSCERNRQRFNRRIFFFAR